MCALWDEMLATDPRDSVTEHAVPGYFCHEVYDYTVSYQLARQYAERLQAPLKPGEGARPPAIQGGFSTAALAC